MDRTFLSKPPCTRRKCWNSTRGVLLALYTALSLSTVAFAETSTTESEHKLASHLETVTQKNNAAIKGNAFQNAHGFISINQSSGESNQQYNALTISNGISSSIVIEADESILADTSSGNGLNDLNPSPTSQSLNSANIAPDTFAGASGVVQINQTAGTGNVSANLFTLSIGDSVKP